MELRDRGCAFPGCDRPPAWCHGHHIRSWLDGGSTTLANGTLLCGYHHRLIPPRSLASPHGAGRGPRIHPTRMDRPAAQPHPQPTPPNLTAGSH
ncbi:HNH endonuclease signature motif containing protein [Actinopolymorpha alba]|uniref:HNH endonuclease signature motif containing protein n=1 Tax=Actinopolymorpha alba TaxID=533267 RepID=UPI001ED9B5FA|nr:HNH endonuclease signature motif containing protein [Actinopolymorpha alba]